MCFINKVVLITGAGSGIGAAIAQHFAKLNAKLCLLDLNLESLTKVCEESEKISKTKVLKLVADISREEHVRKSVEDVLQEFGQIDILINCAGIHGPGSVKDSDILEKYDRVMAVNLRAIVAITSQATPALIKTKGCVINIASISSSLMTKDTLPYNLSKAGVTTFTKCTALNLAADGVRVNCISPGPVKTNILTSAGVTESDNEAYWEAAGKVTPLRGIVEAVEIAKLVAFLASDKAKSITGSDFVIDSGVLLGGSAAAPHINFCAKS